MVGWRVLDKKIRREFSVLLLPACGEKVGMRGPLRESLNQVSWKRPLTPTRLRPSGYGGRVSKPRHSF